MATSSKTCLNIEEIKHILLPNQNQSRRNVTTTLKPQKSSYNYNFFMTPEEIRYMLTYRFSSQFHMSTYSEIPFAK